MKNIKVSILGAFAFAMVLFAGCDDPCKDVTCLNGGTCLEGTCECPTGYEGADCAEALNAKFTGTFNQSASDCDSTNLGPYPIALTPSSTDPVEFTLGGLYENSVGNRLNCEVSTSNSNQFTIPTQNFEDDFWGPGFTMEGTGSIEGNTITVSYTMFDVTNSATWDECTESFTK